MRKPTLLQEMIALEKLIPLMDQAAFVETDPIVKRVLSLAVVEAMDRHTALVKEVQPKTYYLELQLNREKEEGE